MQDFIHNYWENQAISHGDSHEASWGDKYMIELEIETIGSEIPVDSTVLDIGCANGHATFRQLEQRKPRKIVGIDFAPSMIEMAIKSKNKMGLGDEIEFQVGDVRNIEQFSDHVFDMVYTTRVIINLPSWEQQQKGIMECLRVTKPGGTVILSEAFWEPLQLLNALRLIKQLPPLEEHDFNRYMKKEKLERFLSSHGLNYRCEEFSSIYYLGSRFLRELVTDVSAYPGYSNPINKDFFELENRFSGGGFGIQQAYIIEKS